MYKNTYKDLCSVDVEVEKGAYRVVMCIGLSSVCIESNDSTHSFKGSNVVPSA